MSFTVRKTAIREVREPLLSPFGFKGGALTELWQVVVGIETEDGRNAVGVGLQSVLWSDGGVGEDGQGHDRRTRGDIEVEGDDKADDGEGGGGEDFVRARERLV